MQEGAGRTGLSIGDGFKFGCGLILAFVVFNILIAIIFAIIAVVGALLGYTFSGGVPQF